MFYEATQQATLPIEQRMMTPELLYQRLGVEMGKVIVANADVFIISEYVVLEPEVQISPLPMNKEQTRVEKESAEPSLAIGKQ